MIFKINKLKNFGIFQEYTPDSSLGDFKRYNLFYGWNGSGKSTLANLFRWVETKQPTLFSESEWDISTDLGNINQSNVAENNLNIRVFNKDFVEKNVFTPTGVKGIVYISEKKKTEKTQLELKENDFKTKDKELKKIKNELYGDNTDKKSKGLIEKNDTFLSEAAKKIKSNFKVIEIEDSRLLNYNKTKLTDFILENKSIQAKKNTLSVSEIETLSKGIKPQEKTKIDSENIILFDTTLFTKIYERVVELQLTGITAKTIDRLKENPNIAKWVFQGLKEIHSETSTKCEFCNQDLPASRIADLNKHFSEEFTKLKESLAKGIEWIEEKTIKIELPHSSEFYEEFKAEYETVVVEYKRIVELLNNILGEWRVMLEEKQNNPFDIPQSTISEISLSNIEEYNNAYKEIIKCISKHNDKFLNLTKVVNEAKQKLELHYVSEEISTYDYLNKKLHEEDLLKNEKLIDIEIKAIELSIKTLKQSLSDEILGAEEFNTMLHKFLGRNDLSIEPRTEGGYFIKRYQTEEAKNLSEGEKTAIGLIYFIAKLREDGNKLEETIVVIDDPISSLDSNHLFHSSYYIKIECEKAKQLFVLTHNFRFFSMQKEWIFTSKETKEIYIIKPQVIDEKRNGNIENADNILTHFDSEYHMLFSEVKKFIDNPKNDYISTHTISNICRQLLESFLSFKYGRKKLDKCFDEITGFTDLPKVRKFVNHYSHKVDNGESIKGFNDNVFSEVEKIVPLVLELMKHVDEVHFNSMTARLNNN